MWIAATTRRPLVGGHGLAHLVREAGRVPLDVAFPAGVKCREAVRVRLRGHPKRVADLDSPRSSVPLPPPFLLAHVPPRRPRRSPLAAGDTLLRDGRLASFSCSVPCNLVYTASQTLHGIASRPLKVPACIALLSSVMCARSERLRRRAHSLRWSSIRAGSGSRCGGCLARWLRRSCVGPC